MAQRVFALVLLLSLTAGTAIDSQSRAAGPGPDQRTRFQRMFARGYFPGRTGQLLVVPREGAVLTRDEAALRFMHGSPWAYDTAIPLFFAGQGVTAGVQTMAARQQDIAPTLAAALGTAMPPTATGRVLPIRAAGTPPPRAIALIVLDGMRRDYFTRYAADMPALTRWRAQSAWFDRAQIDYLPTNTAVGHSTIVTGADPRVHGITGNNLFDRAARRRRDAMAGVSPQELMALTLADVWQLQQRGRPVVIALGPSVPAATALAGHGACQIGGSRVQVAAYDEKAGRWITNPGCYSGIDAIADMSPSAVWPPDGQWMGHTVNTPIEIRRTALWPRFEADAVVRLIEASEIGKDAIPDLVLLNLKAADYVGHKYGPDSPELRATLAEMDRQVARIVAALESRVGRDLLLAFTADHGMPGEPPAADLRRFAPAIVDALNTRFDPQRKALVTSYEPENAQLFVDEDRLAELGVTLDALKRFLEAQPYIAAAFTDDEIRRTALR